MSELKICRICLRTEAKVYHYEQFQLKAYYEEVLAMKVIEKDDLPHYFCFECATLLHKFHKFKEKCYSGQKVLKEMLIKGPAGILEQLKLRNMEMSSPLCYNSSQDIEVYPFVDTEIDINNLPIVTDGFISKDPVEIDSCFIHSPNIVLQDERMIKNISNQSLDKVKPFQIQTVKIGSNISKSNNIEFDDEHFIENEQSPIVICELPSSNEKIHESNLSYLEMDSIPTENIDNLNDESSSAIFCELSSVSQFDETNLQYIENNLTLESQNDVDFNMGNVNDHESSPIIHLPSTSKDLFETCLEHEENNLKPLEQNLNQKVRLTLKNQVAPNIHGVSSQRSSEQYFDALDDLNIENEESDDSLNQLNVDHDCIPAETMNPQTRKKRSRRKNTVSKQVKPIPCNRKCGNNCSIRVTELDRQVIHDRYWKMDKQEQQEWLLSCIKPKGIRRRQGSTLTKNVTYDYFIWVADKNVKVCQQFLMKTLDVSQMRFRYAILKLGSIPDSKSEDKDSDSDTDTS